MKLLALPAFALVLLRALPAYAADGPKEVTSSSPCQGRAAYFDEELTRDARNARVWTVGWGITSAATSGFSFTLGALENDRNKRIGDYVWGGASLIPLALLVLFPLRVMRYPGTFEAEDAASSDPCASLPHKEAFLAESAAQEAAGVAWYSHAAGIAFNVGLGVGLGAGLHEWRDNLVSAGIGVFLCELQILTQPVGAIRAQHLAIQGRWQLSPLAIPNARGLTAGVTF